MSKPSNFSTSNTLITTKQYYVPTKGDNLTEDAVLINPSSTSIVTKMSRPNTNGINNNNPEDYTAPFGAPRPMKQWRKQLNPAINSGKGNISIDEINRPGGSIFRGVNAQCTCDSSGNKYITLSNKFLFSSYKSIKPSANVSIADGTNNNKIQNNGFIQVGSVDSSNSYQIQTGLYETKRICGTPENKVIKSAVTKLSKSYYTDSRSYLKSRCKLYEQKQATNKVSGNTYFDSNGTALYPNNSSSGPQVYRTNNCSKDTSQGDCNITIHKPNNRQFATQGAVESGTRLMKLKYDTITKNGASFMNAFGSEGANAGRYHGTSESPYFLKSKTQKAICHRKNGDKTLCK